jgi:hypothetical protein
MREGSAMLERLWRRFGKNGRSTSPDGEYEPVYGLPRHEVEQWLERNPHLREKYEAELQERKQAWKVGDG